MHSAWPAHSVGFAGRLRSPALCVAALRIPRVWSALNVRKLIFEKLLLARPVIFPGKFRFGGFRVLFHVSLRCCVDAVLRQAVSVTCVGVLVSTYDRKG